MSEKKEIINRILIRLGLRTQKLPLALFISSRTDPGKWNYQGKIMTRDECLQIPAEKSVFVNFKRRVVAA